MNKIKLILTVGLMFIVLFAQAGNVAAAPLAQDPAPITGTITDITIETATTVIVTLVDDLGATQTVRISVDTAASLGLLILDPATNQPIIDPVTGLPVPDLSKIGTTVEIDSTTVIPDAAEPVHPLSDLLAGFFGVDASVIDQSHEDGFGFGLIAQALWMTQNLNGEISFDAILQAKKDKSGTFTLSDGTEITYTNWGQFRKALLNKKNNLGSVVSGHADESSTPAPKEHGNGQGNANQNGNGNGHGNNNDKSNGKNK